MINIDQPILSQTNTLNLGKGNRPSSAGFFSSFLLSGFGALAPWGPYELGQLAAGSAAGDLVDLVIPCRDYTMDLGDLIRWVN